MLPPGGLDVLPRHVLADHERSDVCRDDGRGGRHVVDRQVGCCGKRHLKVVQKSMSRCAPRRAANEHGRVVKGVRKRDPRSAHDGVVVMAVWVV